MSASSFDPGLQAERTELAWRRTTLSLAIGSIVAMRILPAILDHPLWVIPGVLGLVAAGIIWAASRHRYTRVSGATLEHGERAVLPDGRLPLLVASTAFGVGLFGVVVLAIVVIRAG